MLDVNNDKLSSESEKNKPTDNNEKTPVKASEKIKESAEVESSEAGVSEADDKQKDEVEVTEKVADLPVDSKSDEKEKAQKTTEEATDETIVSETKEADAVTENLEAEDTTEKVNDVTEVTENKEVKLTKEVAEKEVEELAEKVAEKNAEKDAPAGVEDDEAPKSAKKEIPVIDAAKLNLEEIVVALSTLLHEFELKDVKHQVDSLKIQFQKKFKGVVAEAKAAFIQEGGNEIDFYYTSPTKNQFDALLREYKKKRQQIFKDIEREQKENLAARLLLIDELKDLIDNAEASTMYKNFKVLQEKWRGIGQIPHVQYNDVWRTYHHHVERFYDLLHLNNDFRDLDFKHNLEEKTKLIERAETLAQDEDINYAFKELQVLHKLWKEDIGPVARELREDIWQRFSEATKKIHKKRHEYQDKLEEKFNENVDLKLAVIEKIKAIKTGENDSHRTWQEQIKKLEAYRDEFFAIGRVPKSKNEEIWQLFRDSTKSFNTAKNAFYKSIKKEQSENLKKKLMLVDQAESLKDSEDWAEATEVFKKIQSDWKKIGHVPRRDSDKIWKRFKEACNHYFDRLHEKQNDFGKDQSELIDNKKAFIDDIKQTIEKEKKLTLDFIEENLNHWKSMGALPQKVKHLDSKFNKVLDTAFKKMNLDKDEADFIRFKTTVDQLMDKKNARRLDHEQLFIRRKIDEITKEIKQLENNISFISNASEDNPLVKNVYKNIEDQKKGLEIWKRKISYMNKLEY